MVLEDDIETTLNCIRYCYTANSFYHLFGELGLFTLHNCCFLSSHVHSTIKSINMSLKVIFQFFLSFLGLTVSYAPMSEVKVKLPNADGFRLIN